MPLNKRDEARIVEWLRILEKTKTGTRVYFMNNMTFLWLLRVIIKLNKESNNLLRQRDAHDEYVQNLLVRNEEL